MPMTCHKDHILAKYKAKTGKIFDENEAKKKQDRKNLNKNKAEKKDDVKDKIKT